MSCLLCSHRRRGLEDVVDVPSPKENLQHHVPANAKNVHLDNNNDVKSDEQESLPPASAYPSSLELQQTGSSSSSSSSTTEQPTTTPTSSPSSSASSSPSSSSSSSSVARKSTHPQPHPPQPHPYSLHVVRGSSSVQSTPPPPPPSSSPHSSSSGFGETSTNCSSKCNCSRTTCSSSQKQTRTVRVQGLRQRKREEQKERQKQKEKEKDKQKEKQKKESKQPSPKKQRQQQKKRRQQEIRREIRQQQQEQQTQRNLEKGGTAKTGMPAAAAAAEADEKDDVVKSKDRGEPHKHSHNHEHHTYKASTKSYVHPGTLLPAPYHYVPLYRDTEEDVPLNLDYPVGRYEFGHCGGGWFGYGENGACVGGGASASANGGGGGWYDMRTLDVELVASDDGNIRQGQPARHSVGLSTLWNWDWPAASDSYWTTYDTSVDCTAIVPLGFEFGAAAAAAAAVDPAAEVGPTCSTVPQRGWGSVVTAHEHACAAPPLRRRWVDCRSSTADAAAAADAACSPVVLPISPLSDGSGGSTSRATPAAANVNHNGSDVWTNLRNHVPGAAVGFGGRFPFDDYLRGEEEYRWFGLDPREDDDEEDDDGGGVGWEKWGDAWLVEFTTPFQYEFADFGCGEAMEAAAEAETETEASKVAARQETSHDNDNDNVNGNEGVPPPAPVVPPTAKLQPSPDQIRRAHKLHTKARAKARGDLGLTEVFNWNVDCYDGHGRGTTTTREGGGPTRHSHRHPVRVFDIDEIVIPGDDNVSTISDDVSLPACLVEMAGGADAAAADDDDAEKKEPEKGEEGGATRVHVGAARFEGKDDGPDDDDDGEEDASATRRDDGPIALLVEDGSAASSDEVQAVLARAEAARMAKHCASAGVAGVSLSSDGLEEDSREVLEEEYAVGLGGGPAAGSMDWSCSRTADSDSDSESSGYVSIGRGEAEEDDENNTATTSGPQDDARDRYAERGDVSGAAAAGEKAPRQEHRIEDDNERSVVRQVVFDEPHQEDANDAKLASRRTQEHEEGQEQEHHHDEPQVQVQPPKPEMEQKTRRPMMPRSRPRSIRVSARKRGTWDEACVGAFSTAVEPTETVTVDDNQAEDADPKKTPCKAKECSSTLAQPITDDPEIVVDGPEPLESDAASPPRLELALLRDELACEEDDRVSLLTDDVEGDDVTSDGFMRYGNGAWTEQGPLMFLQRPSCLTTVEESPVEESPSENTTIASSSRPAHADEEERDDPAHPPAPEVDESTRADERTRTVDSVEAEGFSPASATTSTTTDSNAPVTTRRKSNIPPPKVRRRNVASPVFTGTQKSSPLVLKLGNHLGNVSKGCDDSARTVDTECSTHPSDDGSMPYPSPPVPTDTKAVIGRDARQKRRAIEAKLEASRSSALPASVPGPQQGAGRSARTLEVAILNSLREKIDESVRITDVVDDPEEKQKDALMVSPPSSRRALQGTDADSMMQRLKSERERAQSRANLLRRVGLEGASN